MSPGSLPPPPGRALAGTGSTRIPLPGGTFARWSPARPRERGTRQLCLLCRHRGLPSAEDSGDDDRVAASTRSCLSQPSRNSAGVTLAGGSFRLLWWIHALRLIAGAGPPPIHHEARIHHGNVAEAADVRVAAPSPRQVAHRPRECGVCVPRAPNRGRASAGMGEASGPSAGGAVRHSRRRRRGGARTYAAVIFPAAWGPPGAPGNVIPPS